MYMYVKNMCEVHVRGAKRRPGGGGGYGRVSPLPREFLRGILETAQFGGT